MGALALLLLVAGASQAAEQKVELGTRSYSRLCPQHIGGDREYSGNGPEVEILADLRLDGDPETKLSVCFWMHQLETKADWSEAELDRCFPLYTAPVGKRITRIYNARESYRWYRDTDHAEDRYFQSDTLVKDFRVKGDTGGKDIGNCTSDDAYLTVTLEPISLWIE
jgi:hypothetical protein